MKVPWLLLYFLLFLSATLIADPIKENPFKNKSDARIKEGFDDLQAVNEILAEYFNSSSFSIKQLALISETSGEKKLKGTVIFFQQDGVDLECVLTAEKKLKLVSAVFPASANITLNHFDKLSQGRLRQVIPITLMANTGMGIKSLSLAFDGGGSAEQLAVSLISQQWDFLNYGNFNLKNIEVKLSYLVKSSLATGEIIGNITLGSALINVSSVIGSDKSLLFTGSIGQSGGKPTLKDALYSMAGKAAVDSLFGLVPGDAFLGITMPDVKFTASPTERSASISAHADAGEIMASIHKKGAGKAIQVAMKTKDLGSLLQTSALKDIGLVDPVVIISSSSGKANNPFANNKEVTVQNGLNIVTQFHVTDDLKKIFQVATIDLNGSVDNKRNIMLNSIIKMDIPLGSGGVKFSQVNFGVSSNPKPELFLKGNLFVPLSSNQNLNFEAGLYTAPIPPQFGGSLEMITEGGDGVWKNPFDIPGIGISRLKGGGKLTPIPPFVSELELAGEILLGKDLFNRARCIPGKIDVKLDIFNPVNSHLDASIERLTPIGLIHAFSDAKISGELEQLLNTGIENGRIVIVPKEGRFTAEGDFIMIGLRSSLSFTASQNGVAMAGSMDPLFIKSGDFTIFSLTGADGRGRPYFSVALNENPHFKISGAITALEAMSGSAFLDINKDGFIANLKGNVFNGAFAGELYATGRNLSSQHPELYGHLKLSQEVITQFKTSMNKFIKDQAKNSEKDILAVRNKVNSGSKDFDNALKGSLNVVNTLQKETATAGMMIVENAIPDVTSIEIKGNLSAMGAASVKALVYFKVGGKTMSPIAVSINLNTKDLNGELTKVSEQFGKEVLVTFEGMGQEVAAIGKQAEEFFADIGKGVIMVGQSAGQAANDAINEIDRFWNGDRFDPVQNGAALTEYGPDIRHYSVTSHSVTALTTMDDPIQGKMTEGVGQAVDAVGNLFSGGNSNATQKAMTIEDPEIEIYGAIVVVSDRSMNVSPGTNANAWSRDRIYAEKRITSGKSFAINSTKHFYAVNGTNPSLTVRSKLKEWDEGEHHSSDGEFIGVQTIHNLGSWNWNSGQSQLFEFNATTNDGGKTSVVKINYTITLEARVSLNDLQQAVASGNIENVRKLLLRGGNIAEGDVLSNAIRNKDIAMVNFLLASNAVLDPANISVALTPSFFQREIAIRLIARKTTPATPEEFRQAVELGHPEIAAMLLSKGAKPDGSHLTLALQKNNIPMAELIMINGVSSTANDLQQAVNAMNLPQATSLVHYGAQPTVGMLNQAITAASTTMTTLLLTVVKPDISSFQAAADRNDVLFLRQLGTSGESISSDGPSRKAIDHNNMELLQASLDLGADASLALSYAIERSNDNAIQVCLNNRANADLVLPYAVNKNNVALLTELITKYQADGNEALKFAVTAKNPDMMKLSLKDGKASPNLYVPSMAAEGQDNLLMILLDHNGDPSLAVGETINRKNVNLLANLIQRGAYVAEDAYVKQAAELQSLPMVQLLVNNGANAQPAMASAIAQSNYQMTEFLLSKDASPQGHILTVVSKGDVNLARLLLNYGANPNEGITQAVTSGKADMANLLLQNGASPNDQLEAPSKAGDVAMVTLLLKFGANPTEGIKSAVQNNHTPVAALLLERGASPAGLLNIAAGFGNLTIVKLLIERGINPNEGIKSAVVKNSTEVSLFLLANNAAITGLIAIAAELGNEKVVDELLKRGAVPQEGITAAVTNNHVRVAEILINGGAHVTSSSFMDIAVRNKQEPMVRLLFNNKCDVKAISSDGNSYLHIVCNDDGLTTLAKAFIEFGLDINLKNAKGNTALHLAAMSGRDNLDVVRVLVEAGADVNAENGRGETPRKSAKGNKVKKYLKDQGGNRKN